MAFHSPMDVGAVLRQLQELRIRCVGARPRGARGIELVLDHPDGPDALARSLEQAWPHAATSTVLERNGEGRRLRLEVAPDLHLRWSMATSVTARFSSGRDASGSRAVRPRTARTSSARTSGTPGSGTPGSSTPGSGFAGAEPLSPSAAMRQDGGLAPAAPPPEPTFDDNRLAAFEVGRSDAEDELDVVLASTPEEAARCFLRGWGVPDGSLLAVRWSEQPQAIALGDDGEASLPNLRVYRVVHGAVVAVPGWSG